MNGGVDEYHYLGWSRKVGSSIRSDVSGYNSVLSSRASVGKDCYLEVSYVHGNSRIGSHSVLSYIDVQDQVIPDNVVLHGLKQRNGKFIVRIFGVNDNPKENRLFGRDLDELEDTLGVRLWEENGQAHAHVLAMEQIMSTGGGWQDQVGGITPGLKYITSMPGLQQQLQVAHIELSPQTKKELDERFVLIYTGQRRLARNLLRDVVGRYVGNEPDSLFALEEIQKTAALMRFELERGNVDGFAKLLDYHWELSKKIDAGSSNTLIEQIFSSIEELVDGKLVCGAGGGGFLQVILKKGVTRQMVEERLKEVFMDSLVGVADCNLVWE